MKRFVMGVSALALLLAATPRAGADLVTFDDAGEGPLANGYHGFTWNNFYALNAVNYDHNSGYFNGMVSSPNVAYNGYGGAADVSRSTPFTFTGAYLTGAWNDGLSVEVQGSLNGTLKHDQTVTVNSTSPTFFTFNYQNIDTLHFVSSGGTPHGYNGGGEHFALDNFTFTAPDAARTPEPSGIVLLALGVAGVGGVWWRKRRRAAPTGG